MRELEEGCLRQGWGYDPCQDLRRIQKKVAAGKQLNDDEQDARRNRRLLDTEPGGVKPGDVLLLPNLPEDGWWVMARVAGPYTFAISNESSIAGKDYGHIVPVEPVRDREGGIAKLDPHNENVDARLRATMRNMSRMWSSTRLATLWNAYSSLSTRHRHPRHHARRVRRAGTDASRVLRRSCGLESGS
jgi:hypothetical protein